MDAQRDAETLICKRKFQGRKEKTDEKYIHTELSEVLRAVEVPGTGGRSSGVSAPVTLWPFMLESYLFSRARQVFPQCVPCHSAHSRWPAFPVSLTDLFLCAFIFLAFHTPCRALVKYGWLAVRLGRLGDNTCEAGRVFS